MLVSFRNVCVNVYMCFVTSLKETHNDVMQLIAANASVATPGCHYVRVCVCVNVAAIRQRA